MFMEFVEKFLPLFQDSGYYSDVARMFQNLFLLEVLLIHINNYCLDTIYLWLVTFCIS
jgi:hypothetical protein